MNLELEQRIEERTRNLQQEIEHRKSVEKKLQRQMHHLDVMRQIDKHIIANRDLNETMQRIVDFSIQQLDVDAAQIVLKQSFLQSFEQVAVGGELCEKIKEIHHKLDYEQFAEVIKNKNMIAIPDLRDGPEWFPNRQLFIANGLNSYFNVPLVIEGDLKGFFIVIRSKDEQPDEEWFRYLESFAGQAVIAVDSTILFWELLQINSEMTIAYDTTLEGWAKVLEIRDYETAGHTYRVTDLTITLASLMGFNSDELAHIYRGAVLHDIGKMGIPDKILLKEGPLTEAERMIINQHPQFAYDMLYEITYLVPAIDIPFCHHEKWDGSGYPRGIAGMEIPRAARIFAVVDVYDALTSDRPYRKAWPVEKTLKYIEVESGKHFDPEIVDVVLNYLQKSIPHTD